MIKKHIKFVFVCKKKYLATWLQTIELFEGEDMHEIIKDGIEYGMEISKNGAFHMYFQPDKA